MSQQQTVTLRQLVESRSSEVSLMGDETQLTNYTRLSKNPLMHISAGLELLHNVIAEVKPRQFRSISRTSCFERLVPWFHHNHRNGVKSYLVDQQ
jgi:hypothetical protein